MKKKTLIIIIKIIHVLMSFENVHLQKHNVDRIIGNIIYVHSFPMLFHQHTQYA